MLGADMLLLLNWLKKFVIISNENFRYDRCGSLVRPINEHLYDSITLGEYNYWCLGETISASSGCTHGVIVRGSS